MAYSTANWHWKNKTVTPWAKEWFERELVTIQVQGDDGAVVSVERVVEVDGDVELGRRKSKYVLTSSVFLLKFATPSNTIEPYVLTERTLFFCWLPLRRVVLMT